MKNVSSLGPVDVWGMVAELVKDRPNQWRKVARYVNRLRQTWISAAPPEQVKRETLKYARRAYMDTILPPEVMFYLRQAVMAEFNFDINP